MVDETCRSLEEADDCVSLFRLENLAVDTNVNSPLMIEGFEGHRPHDFA